MGNLGGVFSRCINSKILPSILLCTNDLAGKDKKEKCPRETGDSTLKVGKNYKNTAANTVLISSIISRS